jgi:hypothetical protein
MGGMVLAATLTGCGPAARTAVHIRAADSHAGALRPCKASVLSGRGGRQGENTTAHGDIYLTNTSAVACTLYGVPRIELIRADGSVLPVRQTMAGAAPHRLVLPAGKADAGWLTIDWSNWCGAQPGPLRLRLALSHSDGTLLVPFNGPPDYNYVPVCISRIHASTIELTATAQGPAP